MLLWRSKNELSSKAHFNDCPRGERHQPLIQFPLSGVHSPCLTGDRWSRTPTTGGALHFNAKPITRLNSNSGPQPVSATGAQEPAPVCTDPVIPEAREIREQIDVCECEKSGAWLSGSDARGLNRVPLATLSV